MAFNFSGLGQNSVSPGSPFTQPSQASSPFHSSQAASSRGPHSGSSSNPPSSRHHQSGQSSSGPEIDPALLENEVPARFIDTLANQFGFGDTEQDLRRNLHGYAKLGRGLPKALIIILAYLLAAVFSLIKENRAMTSANRLTQGLLTDLQIRLEATFTLSTEQKQNVRIIAGDLMFDCGRIKFMTIHFDVEVKIKQSQKDLSFTNIYGNPAREKILMMFIKRQCSSVRNAFREMLRDSVMGDDTYTLSDFIVKCAARFKIGATTSGLGPAYTARLAILRRFAYEHPELVDREEEPEDDGSGPSADDSQETTRSTTGEPARKKRKRGGRVPKGEDFWSQAEKWFEARKAQWGDSWTTPGWSAYIAETVAKDEDRYRVQVVQNPFMEDVPVDEAYHSGSGTTVQSNAAGLGAVEDLFSTL